MTVFSLKLKISTERVIGAPEHRKYVLYGLNTIDKRYMKGKMNGS